MKDIKGYEGLYQVTQDGKIWSVNKQKYLSPTTYNDGVLKVALYKEGKKKTKAVHRLVAEAYIQNPENKPQVDHIDGNKQNNNINNLRWCTNAENQMYRDQQSNSGKEHGGRKPKGKQVEWGNIVYSSLNELARHIAGIRGSKVDTIKKELKAIRYGGKVLYGQWCELV